MSVVISIVSFNTKKLLEDCLLSILNQKFKEDVRVWVVDNASGDGSVEMIKKNFPEVRLIESKKNLGFGAGHNLVFKKTKADYFLVLNSDTIIENGAIEKMVDFMKQNPTCGIAGCKIKGFDGNLQPNGGDLPFGWSLLTWLFNLETFGIKSPSFHRSELKYYNSAHEVGWISGSFMLIRKEVINKIGFFNEKYFMYFEDVEFCQRANEGGFSIMINPRVEISHLSGGSLDKPQLRQWTGEYRGLIRFYQDKWGALAAIFIKFLIIISTVLRILAFLSLGQKEQAKTYAKVIASL